MGLVSGPKGVKASLAIKRLTVGELSIVRAGSSMRLGPLVVDGCLDCSGYKAKVVSARGGFAYCERGFACCEGAKTRA